MTQTIEDFKKQLADITKCHIHPMTGNIVTPVGVLMSDKFLLNASDKGKHSLEIVFKPDTDLVALKNAMGNALPEAVRKDPTLARNFINKRFLDPNNKPSGGKPMGAEFEGWTLVRAASDSLPDFILPSGQKCPANRIQTELYRGREGRATLNAYWLDTKTPEGATVKGVFLGLVNIQLLGAGKPVGYVKPSGEDEFGAVEVEGASPAAATPSNASVTSADQLF